jgi:DegV family protein with EDD domain
MFRIVTDGSADMPADWIEKYGIKILPLNIQIGDKCYQEGINLTRDQFYGMVTRYGIIPKTSLPSPRQVMDFYQRFANLGDTILSIHLASKLSGTFSIVQTAAQELKDKFKIYTFDSGGGSAVLGYMCREARRLEQAGTPIQDILDRLDSMRRRITLVFTVDNLEFARLSGRVNSFQSTLSSLLHIKPIIVLRDGLLELSEKVRTRRKSLDRIIELVRQKVGDRAVNIAIVHAMDLLDAEEMVKKVRSILNCQDVILTDLSIPVASHLGPGTIGIVAYPVEEEK